MTKRKTALPESPETRRVTLIRGARQLLTMRGDDSPRRGAEMRAPGIISDGALLIVDGVIQEVGPSRRVEKLAVSRDAEEIDASGKVVMPGFVDCQTNLLGPPPALDDFEARCLAGRFAEPRDVQGPGSEAARAMRSYSAQRLEMEGRRQLRTVWRCGTTTVSSTSGAGLDEASELRALRVLDSLSEHPLHVVPSFGGALAVAPEYAGRPAEYLAWLESHVWPEMARRKLAVHIDISAGDGAFGLEQAEAHARAAGAHGLRVNLRLRGPAADLPQGAARVSGVSYLDRSAERLAASRTVAVLLPCTGFHQGSEAPEPARELIDRGAAVALATGFHTQESPIPCMATAVSLACAQLRLSPAEALTAATINGAHSLGIGNETGSLEIGKWADLLIMNAGDYREIPLHLGVNPLLMALRRGEVIYPRVETP